MPKSIFPLAKKDENEVEAENPKSDRIVQDITFFGDSSIPDGSELYQEVWETAKLLAEHGYSIVNGGGPGVMKAATDGASSVGGRTVAVYWQPKLASIFEGRNLSNETTESEAYSNYMMRTLGLIEKGHVYVVCRGGTGTVSEFGMVWALAKLYYGKHKPVILYGDFWKGVIDSIQKAMLIDDNELAVLNYATTKEEVLDLIESFELEVSTRTHKTYNGDETPFVLAPRFDEAYKARMRDIAAKRKYLVRNAVTEKQLYEFKDLVTPPARILEVGCKGGYDTGFLADHYSVTAIDNNKELLEIARFENPNVDMINIDIRDYELQENVFKGIWARDVLHHFKSEELPGIYSKLAKGLVPGGILYVIVRAGDGEGMEEDVHAGEKIEKFYHYYSEEEIRNLSEQAGLEVVKVDKITRSHPWIAAVLRKPE